MIHMVLTLTLRYKSLHDNFQGGDHKFVPVSEGYVDYGHLYAANTFTDPHGRQILYGWVSESLSDETVHNNGWAGRCISTYIHCDNMLYKPIIGMQSVPRVISLSSRNTLLFNPPEVCTYKATANNMIPLLES